MSTINETDVIRERIGQINIPTVGYKNQLVESINGDEGGICTIRLNGKRYFFRNSKVAPDSQWINLITAYINVDMSYGSEERTISVKTTSVFPKYGQKNWLNPTEWAHITIDSVSVRDGEGHRAIFDVVLFTMNDKVTVSLETNIAYISVKSVKDIYFTIDGATECVSGDSYTGQVHQSRYAEWANIANRATLASEVELKEMMEGYDVINFHEAGVYFTTIRFSDFNKTLTTLVTVIPNGASPDDTYFSSTGHTLGGYQVTAMINNLVLYDIRIRSEDGSAYPGTPPTIHVVSHKCIPFT